MKIKGIKRGRMIELLEKIDIADGAEVIVEIEGTQPFNEEEKLKKLHEVFGAWSNQPEIDTVFSEIDSERHNYQGREIEFIE